MVMLPRLIVVFISVAVAAGSDVYEGQYSFPSQEQRFSLPLGGRPGGGLTDFNNYSGIRV